MSELQFYILVTSIVAGLGGIMTVIRWSVGLVSKTINSNTQAMIENTKSNAILSTKIDNVTDWVARRTTGQQAPLPKKGKLPTNPFGNLVPLKDPDDE